VPDAPEAPPAGAVVDRLTPGAVHFGVRVILSKEEAFGACQVLADAGRHLLRTGGTAEADSLGSLFELLEERLVAR
jgi:hypothetical protein